MNQTTVVEYVEIQNLLDLRMFAYDILRRVFMEEPSKQLVIQLQEGLITNFPFRNENGQIKEGLKLVKQYLSNFSLEEDYDSLHWDYTRMFIGPYELPAPIWESSYVNKDGLLFQEETLIVRRIYLENCFESLQYGHEPEDHLGLELDFMYQLNLLARDSLKQGDMVRVKKTLTNQQHFLIEHLLNWTPHFAERVIKHANTNFYKGLANILVGFLTVDEKCLKEVLAIEM